jgi:hypothetical protein
VEFEDGNTSIDTRVFDGKFQIFSLGGGLGVALGWSLIEMGGAVSEPKEKWHPGLSIGFGISAAAFIGASGTWGIEIKDCPCAIK